MTAAGCGDDDTSPTTQAPTTTGVATTAAPAGTTATTTATTAPPTTKAPTTTAAVAGPPQTLMLDARTRDEVPWDEVDESWALILFSTEAGYQDLEPIDEERVIIYLVDPNGTPYEISRWPLNEGPNWIYDVRPDAQRALLRHGYDEPMLLDLTTGESLPLPFTADAWDYGFTRPTGRDYLTVTFDGEIALYSADGTFQRTLGRYLEEEDFHFGPQRPWVYAPDGLGLVVNGLEGPAYHDNQGNRVRGLAVGSYSLCHVLSWWDQVTVLMRCLEPWDEDYVFGMWLVDAEALYPNFPITEPSDGPDDELWQGFVEAMRGGDDLFLQGIIWSDSGGYPIYRTEQGGPVALGDDVAGFLTAAGPDTVMLLVQGCCGEVYGALVVYDHDGNELVRLDAPDGYYGVISAHGVGAPATTGPE